MYMYCMYMNACLCVCVHHVYNVHLYHVRIQQYQHDQPAACVHVHSINTGRMGGCGSHRRK